MPQHQTVCTELADGARPFYVRGVVGRHDAVAEVVGTELVMHPLVRQRAEELVGRGEVFLDPDGHRSYTATLVGHDIARVLTVLRSFDVVFEFEMKLAEGRLTSRLAPPPDPDNNADPTELSARIGADGSIPAASSMYRW